MKTDASVALQATPNSFPLWEPETVKNHLQIVWRPALPITYGLVINDPFSNDPDKRDESWFTSYE